MVRLWTCLLVVALAACSGSEEELDAGAGGSGGSGGRGGAGGGAGGSGGVDAGSDGGLDASVSFLVRPFAGTFRTSNFFDHDVPREFVDTNGRFTTFWGEDTPFIDGHDGYDYVMPEGTPLRAAASGTVQFAGTESPFFCPPLNSTVSGKVVRLDTTAPDGTPYRLVYVHLSRLDVATGQAVTAGQVLGLSGNTGCSTGPHLHFAVYRRTASAALQVDPYGWRPAAVDPWTRDGGVASRELWQAGEAPELYREVSDVPNPGTGNAHVAITRLRFMGVDDAQQPNNEFIELTLDPRFATVQSLDGYSLRNQAGGVFALPAGITLTVSAPTLRLYTGFGADDAGVRYMGRSAPFWANAPGDCAVLEKGSSRYTFWYLSGTCQ